MLIEINTNIAATTQDLINVQNGRWADESVGEKNIIIFVVDNSSCGILMVEKKILILYERPRQCLDNAAITAEAKYPINFTESGK